MTGPILFEITAADSHQQIILPVIRCCAHAASR